MISFGLVHRVLSKLPPSFKIHVLFLKLGTHRAGDQPPDDKMDYIEIIDHMNTAIQTTYKDENFLSNIITHFNLGVSH